jgi:hypothetical protein
MPTALGGYVFETMENMATKTWPCHPTESVPAYYVRHGGRTLR